MSILKNLLSGLNEDEVRRRAMRVGNMLYTLSDAVEGTYLVSRELVLIKTGEGDWQVTNFNQDRYPSGVLAEVFVDKMWSLS